MNVSGLQIKRHYLYELLLRTVIGTTNQRDLEPFNVYFNHSLHNSSILFAGLFIKRFYYNWKYLSSYLLIYQVNEHSVLWLAVGSGWHS